MKVAPEGRKTTYSIDKRNMEVYEVGLEEKRIRYTASCEGWGIS